MTVLIHRVSIVAIVLLTPSFSLGNLFSFASDAEQFTRCDEPPVSIVRNVKSLRFEHCLRVVRSERLASMRLSQQPSIEELTAQAENEEFLEYDVPVLRIWWPDSTFFDVGDDRLRPDALPIIEYVVDVIRQDISQVYTYVIGHTDSTGNSEMNDDLALRRAQRVVRRLSDQQGILLQSLSYTGMGENQPISTNSTSAGRAVNRRVEFVMSAYSRANIAVTRQRVINEEFRLDGPDKEDEFTISTGQEIEVYSLEQQEPYEVYELASGN